MPLCGPCHALVHDLKSNSYGELIRIAKARIRAGGGYGGGYADIGYRVVNGKLVKNKKELAMLKRVLRLIAAGNRQVDLVRMYNDEGVRFRETTKWKRWSMSRLVKYARATVGEIPERDGDGVGAGKTSGPGSDRDTSRDLRRPRSTSV